MKKIRIHQYTIPVDWSIFDIHESKFLSGYSEIDKKRMIVHFDNSISIAYVDNYNHYIHFTKGWVNAIKEWNGPDHEYLETNNINMLKSLFDFRFKYGFRRKRLFKLLNLEPKTYQRKYITRKK